MSLSLTRGRMLATRLPVRSGGRFAANLPSANILFIAAHVPLALLVFRFPALATPHALLTFLIGCYWSISRGRMTNVAAVGAYIAGSEVLWRIGQSSIPWESGKYATSAIFIISLLRNGHFRIPFLPLLYFLLLLPAISPVVMMDHYSLETIRKNLSFNLSGPLALMTCVWFFSHLKLTSMQLNRVFLSVIAPTTAIAVFTLLSTLTAQNINWASESNLVTSGGFGPNQVSGSLGLGTLMALLFLLRATETWIKVVMFVVMVFLATQCALTFSRGGLYGVSGAAILAGFYLVRDRKARLKLMTIGALLFAVAIFVVIPRLESLTEGAIITRFQDTKTAHRADYVVSDLNAWSENPFLGVGVGESFRYNLRRSVSHTELTRLLSEHGLLGLSALFLLLVAGWRSLVLARTNQNRAVVAAMIGWSVLFMLDKAMRLVAPAFAFGLAFATIESDSRQPNPRPKPVTSHSFRRRRRATEGVLENSGLGPA